MVLDLYPDGNCWEAQVWGYNEVAFIIKKLGLPMTWSTPEKIHKWFYDKEWCHHGGVTADLKLYWTGNQIPMLGPHTPDPVLRKRLPMYDHMCRIFSGYDVWLEYEVALKEGPDRVKTVNWYEDA